MLWSRGLVVWSAVLVGVVGVVGSSLRAADQIDTGIVDRRTAVQAASNVFVGQVVGEVLYCLATSAPDHYVVYEHFQLKVERNLKGRLLGTVLVRQDTDDTVQFGPDGRFRLGEKYLVLARPLWQAEGFAIVDHRLGYEHLAGPDERADVAAEVRAYLAETPPAVDTPTAVPPDTRATWDAQETRNAATRAAYPTPFPCGPEVVGTATASATYRADGDRGLGAATGPPPIDATPYPSR